MIALNLLVCLHTIRQLTFIFLIFFIFFNVWTSSINAKVKSYHFTEAIKKYQEQNLIMPVYENNDQVQTLNKKGTMSLVFSPTTEAFLKYAKGAKVVLDVGGAYGSAMIEAYRTDALVEYHL
ncbi:MAG: hypothetical protein ACTSXG_02200, partial [Alphaproteobacteria bacterium]